MTQNESLNYFQKYYDLAAPTIQHQVLSFIRPFFPLEEQQQIKNLSPFYKQLIGMITFLIMREEILLEELQRDNLEHHRFKQLLKLVHYYQELKAEKHSRLNIVFDNIIDKPTARAIVDQISQSLRALLSLKFTFQAVYQHAVTSGIDAYTIKHDLKYDSKNPELTNLYDMAIEWHDKPAPTIELLEKLKIELPIPKSAAALSEDERAETENALNVRDLQGLGIKMVPKVMAIFQNADGTPITRARAVEITNIFLKAAQKDTYQRIVHHAKESELTMANPEKLQKLFEKLTGAGAELKTIESVKSPTPSSLFPAISSKHDITDKTDRDKLTKWPPKPTPYKAEPSKG